MVSQPLKRKNKRTPNRCFTLKLMKNSTRLLTMMTRRKGNWSKTKLTTQFGRQFQPLKSMLEYLSLVNMWTTFVKLTSVFSEKMPPNKTRNNTKWTTSLKLIIRIRMVTKMQSKLKKTLLPIHQWWKLRRRKCLFRSNQPRLCQSKKRWLLWKSL